MQVETDFRVSSVISPPQEQTRLNDTLKLNMKVGIFTVAFSLSYMLHSYYRKVVKLTFKYNSIPKCLIIKQFLEVSKQNWQIMRLLIWLILIFRGEIPLWSVWLHLEIQGRHKEAWAACARREDLQLCGLQLHLSIIWELEKACEISH